MPYEIRKGYARRRLRSPGSCARGSFRTVKRGRARIIICCPRGKWSKKAKRCRGGTKAQSIMKRRRRQP